jgi:plasmid stabilization system protein ParE
MTTIKGFQNYLVLYLPIEGGVEIARVIHGSRDVESLLQEPID